MRAPRKRFAQHFLCDKQVIARIVDSLNISADGNYVEIGPGQGALTTEVLRLAKKLTAVELDYDLIPALATRAKRYGELTIHQADALTFDFASLRQDARLLHVFGNLPYNISTPLIFHLLTFAGQIDNMVFMLQKEVADRMAAKASEDHYGRLSVMVQYRCRVDKLFDIAPTAFYPQPQVKSSIVRLTPYKTLPYPALNEDVFATIVREAFNLRRKTLRNSLRDFVADAVWAQVPIASDLRPETLSVQDFVILADAVVNENQVTN